MSEILQNNEGNTDQTTGWENMGVRAESVEEKPEALDVTREIGMVGVLENAKPQLDKLSQEKGGVPVSMDFNGHTIRSDMSEDEIFLEVIGKTKQDFEEAQERSIREGEERGARALAEAEAKMPERIEAGKSLIYTEKQQEWEECVDACTHDLYHGAELDSALRAMTLLDQGAGFDDVMKSLNEDDHSGASYGKTTRIIFSFSKKGPEFYQELREREGRPLTEEEKKIVAEQIEKNAQMEQHDAEMSRGN